MADTQNTNVQEQDIHQLLKVKREKLANLQQAGKDPFQITKYDVTHHSTDIKNNFEELEGKTVRIAGRVMSKRVMGKASFCNVQDLPGNIQVYVARDSIEMCIRDRCRAEEHYPSRRDPERHGEADEGRA